MIHRKDVRVDDEYSIAVVTERMSDGGWAVVSSIKHHLPSGEQTTELPVSDVRYSDQNEAEEAGIQQGRDWIDRNVSRAA